MREVNNNTSIGHVNAKRVNPNFTGENEPAPSSPETDKKIDDLKNAPSEIIGRSQVAQAFMGDVKYMQENPEAVQKTIAYVDKLLADGVQPAKALEMGEAFKNEFMPR